MAVASRAPVRPRHARPAQISFERNQRVSGLRRIAARSAGGLRSRAQPPVVASPSPAPSRAVTALACPPPPAPFGTPSVMALARLRSPVSRGPLPATPRALVGKGHACRAPLSRRRRWARAAPAPATSPARPKPSRRKGARAAPLWLVFRWLRFRRLVSAVPSLCGVQAGQGRAGRGGYVVLPVHQKPNSN